MDNNFDKYTDTRVSCTNIQTSDFYIVVEILVP